MKISNLINIKYIAIKLDGKNNTKWTFNIILHSESMSLGEAIKRRKYSNLMGQIQDYYFSSLSHPLRIASQKYRYNRFTKIMEKFERYI